MVTLNMLGKPCPIPVVEAKKVLSEPGSRGVIVLVDNFIAVQNLEKMAKGLGCVFSWEQKNETEYSAEILTGEQNCPPASAAQAESKADYGGLVILITGDQIGISDAEPGKKLMKNFLYALAQASAIPETMLLVNAGVRLAAEGSESLEDLKTLASRGLNILACGQCLNYYGLTEKLAAGKITNMLEIVEIIGSASRTVTL